MPLDSRGFLNTEPIQGPNSRSGVMNQLRFWGMGKGGQREGLPETHNNMQSYRMDAAGNLARLEDRAMKLRLDNEEKMFGIEAGRAEDISEMKWQQFDMNQPDGLDALSKAVASVSVLGQAAGHITGEVGEMTNSETLKNVSKFIKKTPLIGVGRENAQLQEQMAKTIKALEKNNKDLAQRMYKGMEGMTPLVKALSNAPQGMYDTDYLDRNLEDYRYHNDFLKTMDVFSSSIELFINEGV